MVRCRTCQNEAELDLHCRVYSPDEVGVEIDDFDAPVCRKCYKKLVGN